MPLLEDPCSEPQVHAHRPRQVETLKSAPQQLLRTVPITSYEKRRARDHKHPSIIPDTMKKDISPIAFDNRDCSSHQDPTSVESRSDLENEVRDVFTQGKRHAMIRHPQALPKNITIGFGAREHPLILDRQQLFQVESVRDESE